MEKSRILPYLKAETQLKIIEDLLNSLDRLHKSGLLTNAEYSQKKQEILARM